MSNVQMRHAWDLSLYFDQVSRDNAYIPQYKVAAFKHGEWIEVGFVTQDPVYHYWLCTKEQNGDYLRRASSKEQAGRMLARDML